MRDLAVDNAVSLLVDEPLAEGLGPRPALVTPGGACTYDELAALTSRAARALRELGVEAEQRVALFMPDGIGFAVTFFAALRLGAVAVPLNTRLPAKNLHFILDDCRAKVLVTDGGLTVALMRAAGRGR
jgi:Acyl-CoA synthetases (AMP-forming)/AMP-acid ligases II